MFKGVDEDTGDEIIIFIRRKKPYIYLRDIKTKRFIKRIWAFDVRVTLTFDYPIRKKPLYVDAKGRTTLSDVILARFTTQKEIEDFMADLEDKIAGMVLISIEEEFGYFVRSRVSLEGVSYGSKDFSYDYPHLKIIKLWHHYKGDWKQRVEESWLY